MIVKKCIAGLVRILFSLLGVLPEKKVISFLSRQSVRPFDFQLLEPELNKAFPEYEVRWACVPRGGQLGIGLFLQQLYLVATSAICFVDGYVPAVSVPRKHRCVCIQLWHASGAVKKFGYQCLDTPAGRSSVDAEVFRMHKGYDYIVVGMQGAIPAFEQAFNVNRSLLLPIGLPHLDYLMSEQYASQRINDLAAVRSQIGLPENTSTKIILYAPTFRKGNANADWLKENIKNLSAAFAEHDVLLLVAGHPLDEISHEIELDAGVPVKVLKGSTVKALGIADVVISDYSAIALDAGWMGKPVFFYVPDLEEYSQSPGLNINPLEVFKACASSSADCIAALCLGSQKQTASHTFSFFMNEYAGNVDGNSIDTLLHLLSGIIYTDKN